MSLILDALNRSQRERAATELTDVLAPPPAEPPSVANPWLVRGLAVALLCSLAVLAWLLLERADPAPAAVPALAPGSAGGASAPRESAAAAAYSAPEATRMAPEPRQVSASVGEGRVIVAPAVAPLAVPELPASPPAVAALYAAPATAAAQPGLQGDATRPQAAGARDEAAQAAATAAPEVQAPPALDVEQVVSRAQQEMAGDALPAHPAPLLAELTQQQKNQVPSLLYLRHDYASGAGRSSVLINKRELRVGDSVSGVRVEEIYPDFVVLNYQGTVFRLRALNSWVNL